LNDFAASGVCGIPLVTVDLDRPKLEHRLTS
jgi:hypothetical protein